MKNRVNGIFRKVCNILEWIISAILVVVVVVMCVRFVFELGGMFDSAPVEFFETFVSDIMTLAVGVELIKMLSQHTPATVVEVLMFAIAREMVTHHDSAINTAIGVMSICVLFATRNKDGKTARIAGPINKEMAAAQGRNLVQQPLILYVGRISLSSLRCGQRSWQGQRRKCYATPRTQRRGWLPADTVQSGQRPERWQDRSSAYPPRWRSRGTWWNPASAACPRQNR